MEDGASRASGADMMMMVRVMMRMSGRMGMVTIGCRVVSLDGEIVCVMSRRTSVRVSQAARHRSLR